MINLDEVSRENTITHNPEWRYTPDHPYRIIIGGSRSGKSTAVLDLNLIRYQPDIDKIFLYTKDPFEAKYQLLISKCESVDLIMILKFLLNMLKIWVIFLKILMSTIQENSMEC